MATTGPLQTLPGRLEHPDEGYRSRFDKADEAAEPGYYAVQLKDYGVHAELTATPRVAYHRFAFPATNQAHILFDVGRRQGESGAVLDPFVRRADQREVEGSMVTHPEYIKAYQPGALMRLYFVARLDKTPLHWGTFRGAEVFPQESSINVTDSSLSDELSEKLEDTAARELAGFFGDLFTPSGLRHRLTNWLVAFPAEPLPDGATWSEELPSRAGAKIVAIRYYELVGSTRKDADTFLQVNVTPQFKVSDDTKLKITTQRGDGHVYLDKETHQTREFVLRHGGSIAGFGEQAFDIVYSATLRSEGHEGEQSDELERR